jgi:ABC-type polysaccharide/polyol phosphate transport system ATPase subunit
MLDRLTYWIAIDVGVLLLGEVHAMGGASFEQRCFARVVCDRRITAVGASIGVMESYNADVARMRRAVVARVVA